MKSSDASALTNMTEYSEIPKVIHYCWFGGKKLPALARKCIDSWKKYFPDYEIKQWNESNFDVNIIPYCAEAYKAKKYAFVSDYARFLVLYRYGGLYFDTDVEVIKSMKDIVGEGAFMGCENEFCPTETECSLGVAPGLGLGATAGMELYKDILDLYENLHFQNSDGSFNIKNVVQYTTDLLSQKGLKNISGIQEIQGVRIYPKDYFCPIDYNTKELKITENTRSIHHYAESWLPLKVRLINSISRIVGANFVKTCTRLYNKVLNKS